MLTSDFLGWAVGGDGAGGGTILHTSDGGANWSLQQDVPGISNLRGVDFADANNGWAVGGGGAILHTSDGGATWSPQTSGYGRTIYSVTFQDSQNGWAAGQGPGSLVEGTRGIGTVYHTTDGGDTWSFQHVGLDAYHGTSSFFHIDFADSQHGIATGNSSLGGNEKYRTTDGGVSWTSLSVPGFTLGPVDFVDAQHGWAVGSGLASGNTTILFSSDAGATWTPQFTQASLVLRDIEFADAHNGWAVGNDGVVVHTSDGGACWSVQGSVSESLVGIATTDALTSWAVGLGGSIVHTSDGGANWFPQQGVGTNPLFDVAFVNPVLTVTVDVKPSSDLNPINLASHGVIPVAILGSATFDASIVDPGSVLFAGAHAVQWAWQDVNADGFFDLVVHFRTQDTSLRDLYAQLLADADTNTDGTLDAGVSTRQTATVSLTGALTNGDEFSGIEAVDLFFSGQALRDMLAELAILGMI